MIFSLKLLENPTIKISDKKILIAGSSGTIGSFLNEEFKKDFSVYNIGSKKKSQNNYYTLDLTNKAETRLFSKKSLKFDVIIFLVGLAHKKGIGKEIDEFRNVNKSTLVNLISNLQHQKKKPDKIIFASTISVYGERLNEANYLENKTPLPLSPYALTKLEAENYLLKNVSTNIWILRFAPVYSPSFKMNINRRTTMLGFHYKIGSGDNKLSLCSINNIKISIKHIIKGKVPPGVYNVSDKKEYSYNDLLNYKNAKRIIYIPTIVVKLLYYYGNFINNIFLKENTIKLISSNIFPSNKIRKYVNLKSSLTNTNDD